jgi:hypothetical protein
MSMLTSSIARVSSSARAGRAGPGKRAGRGAGARAGRGAGAVAGPLLAAGALVTGALVTGCGSTHAGAVPGGAAGTGTPGHPSAPAAPSASATPVPTVSGGRVVPGEPACAGWPAGLASAPLPVTFVPVSVERCLNGTQVIPGKGLWTTATLQRSDSGLEGLVNALRRPTATRPPGTVCPAIAVIAPQVVLISANGQKLIPRLPATGCGLTQMQVLAALNALRWQPVSVRLITKIPSATAPGKVSGSAPHSIQTVGGAQ